MSVFIDHYVKVWGINLLDSLTYVLGNVYLKYLEGHQQLVILTNTLEFFLISLSQLSQFVNQLDFPLELVSIIAWVGAARR